MKEGTKSEAARITSVATLGDVRLLEARASRKIRHASEVGDSAVLTVSHGARVSGASSPDGTFYVVAGVEARVAAPDSKVPPFITVKVSYEVSYRLPEGFSATKAELEAFAQTNGVFNVWPYCREFIQSATVRMGLPAIVLPLFRVRHEKPTAKAAGRQGGTKAAAAAPPN